MKPTNILETLVTVEMATEWVRITDSNVAAGKFNQRKPSDSWVRKYAIDMKTENWGDTPEPIVLDKECNIINGQKRLRAVMLSKCPQKFLVYYNWKDNGKVKLINVIDKGQPRSIPDSYRIEGKTYVYQLVAAVNYVCRIAMGGERPDMTFSSTETMLKKFGFEDPIYDLFNAIQSSKGRVGRITGPLAWLMMFNKSKAKSFANDYSDCCGAPGSAVAGYSKWEKNNVGRFATDNLFFGMCAALRAHLKGEELHSIRPEREAVVWLGDRNPELRQKILRMFKLRNSGIFFEVEAPQATTATANGNGNRLPNRSEARASA